MRLKDVNIPDDALIEKMRKRVAERKKVDIKSIEFIGAQDYDDMGWGFYFNIIDKKHPEYMSTLMERHWPL
jgi:hypothetical protein